MNILPCLQDVLSLIVLEPAHKKSQIIVLSLSMYVVCVNTFTSVPQHAQQLFVLIGRFSVMNLDKSSGIESLGAIRWQLVLCLLAVYLICYFSLWKGISTSGKVTT